MNRKLPLALVLLLCVCSPLSAEERPNIIYILADDLGWTDLGCQGSEYYETPHIDRLARQGMRLMRYYNCQNCAPTRAVIMSGQYPTRTGVYTVNSLERGRDEDRRMHVPENRRQLPLEIPLLPQAIREAGYVTGMFGKWHLGRNEHHPGKRGFDEAIESNGRHFDFRTDPQVDYPEGEYLADFLTERAVEFISRHREKPFFLYLSHFIVHTPIVAKEEYVEEWKQKPPAGTHWNPVYAAMIQSLDESVGRVMQQLDELGLSEKTVLIVSSDNGGLGSYDRTEPPAGDRRGFTDNTPLRGGKGTLYEGGLRVPCIVRWPGVVEPGTVNDLPTAHIDLYPTFLEIAGGSAPEGHLLDGVSFVPILNNPNAELDREAIYWHFPGYLQSYVHRPRGWRTTPVGAIHAGDWKLMEFFEEGRLELYNLREDSGEHHDLAERMPEKVRELHGKLADWREKTGADMPTLKLGN